MSGAGRRILFWLPRMLGIAFAVFLSLFALDVFGEGAGFWATAAAPGMHLIPTALVVVALVLAWRWEWIGTVLFGGLAVLYAVTQFRHPSWILTISGPLILIAVLFWVGWRRRSAAA